MAISFLENLNWPLTTPAEVVLASAAAAILWHVLRKRRSKPKLGLVLLYTIVVGLVMWGLTYWSETQAVAENLYSLPQPWLFAAHLTLAVACGAFIEAGSMATACLLLEKRANGEKEAPYSIDDGRYPVLAGLSLLTASLLLQALGGLYTHGVYWSWTALQSAQLLLWLLYSVLWHASTLFEWPARSPSSPRDRGSRVLMALGLILTLVIFRVMSG